MPGFQRIKFLGCPPSPLATIRTKTEDNDQVDEATLCTVSPMQRRHELELRQDLACTGIVDDIDSAGWLARSLTQQQQTPHQLDKMKHN